MARKLHENLDNSSKQKAETLKNATLLKIRKYLKSLEEDLSWLDIEIDDILSGEYDDMFENSYVEKLVKLADELSTNLAKTSKDLHKSINDLD